jgi:hypothetical protein
MDDLIPPSQLATRLKAIRLAPTQLAVLAGLHHTSIMRLMKDPDNWEIKTMRAVSQAIITQELEMLAYLQRLHPGVQAETEKETAA